MGDANWLDNILAKLAFEAERTGNFKKVTEFIRQEYQKALDSPPKIAIIGQSGVGKSTTINSLFNTSLKVSHTKAATKVPTRLSISGQPLNVNGAKGSLILFDMPGIGEDIEKDIFYIKLYAEVIANCDVAVWILSAPDRSIAQDQQVIRDVVNAANDQIASRLVIGVNKVDLIHPANWNKRLNLPSKAQQENLHERMLDIQEKFLRVCPELTKEKIIGYSATRRYKLEKLFGAMLRACPDERAWVLSSRQQIADYWEYVAPDLRSQIRTVPGVQQHDYQ